MRDDPGGGGPPYATSALACDPPRVSLVSVETSAYPPNLHRLHPNPPLCELADPGDPVPDLVEAQVQRMAAEGMETRVRRRYIVWGDKSKT